MEASVNYLGVLIAAVASFIVGFLWHGPLFGKQWIKLMGIPQAEVDAMRAKGMGPMMPQMVAAFIQQLVMAFVLAHFALAWGATDLFGALQLAFWTWLGFIATVLLNGVLWEKRSVNLYLFNIVYHLAALIVMAVALAMFE